MKLIIFIINIIHTGYDKIVQKFVVKISKNINSKIYVKLNLLAINVIYSRYTYVNFIFIILYMIKYTDDKFEL